MSCLLYGVLGRRGSQAARVRAKFLLVKLRVAARVEPSLFPLLRNEDEKDEARARARAANDVRFILYTRLSNYTSKESEVKSWEARLQEINPVFSFSISLIKGPPPSRFSH